MSRRRDLGLVCMALERGPWRPSVACNSSVSAAAWSNEWWAAAEGASGEETFVIAGVVTALEGCSVFTASSGDAEDAANGGDDVE